MKFVIALLVANTAAINIKATPLAGNPSLEPTCVYVNQITGIEQSCDAIGNSAWEPDAPLADPFDLGWKKGFEGLYWFSDKCSAEGCPTTGKPSFSTVNEKINFTSPGEFAMQSKGFPNEHFAAEWYGKVPIKEAGEYEFSTASDDGSRLSINGEKIVENWGLHGRRERKGTIKLNKGYADLKVEFFQNGGGANCIVNYKGPDTADTQKILEGWHDPNL